MRYVSTRGGVPAVSFTEALLTGAPRDGGAYVPERVPKINVKKLSNHSFESLLVETLSLFIDKEDFDRETLRDVARATCKTYGEDAMMNVAPVERLGARRGARDARRYEAFRGPTLSAEDASTQMCARLIDAALKKRGKRANVICATTGEAGGALAKAAAEMKCVDAWIVYPGDEGDVSDEQEREMTCHVEDHVHPVKVFECPDGVSDVDAVVTDVLNDDAFRLANGVVSINTLNVARVLCFVPYFFHAYFQVRTTRADIGKEVVFSIPSSSFALEFAGHLARMMGLPITVLSACNVNGAAHRVVSMGELYKTDMVHTSSSALDVVVSENLWRSIYYASDSNPLILSELQDDFDEDGEVVLPPEIVARLGAVFKSAVVDEETVFATIRDEERVGFIPCPQTAVAIAAIDALRDDIADDVPVVAFAVSHPSKFPEVIRKAIPGAAPTGATHPSIDATHGLFHRRRTCSLEELERSLRRDIPAVSSMRSPAPIKIERLLLSRETYERIYIHSIHKHRGGNTARNKTGLAAVLDNPLLTALVSLAVAYWAKVTAPEPNAKPRAKPKPREADAVGVVAYARRRRGPRPPNLNFTRVPSRDILG